MRRISRRTILRGAGGAAIALPFLEAMRAAKTHAATGPRRFVVMFSANGTLPSAWTPTRTETDFTLSPILAPLAPYQSNLLIVRGLLQQGGGGDGHQNGIGGMLTGRPLNPGPFAGAGAPPAGWATGPSIDQRIASAWSAPTPFRSLELGVHVGAADDFGRMIYQAANQPLPPIDDPVAVYDTVFSDLHTDPAVLAQQRARNKSILDTVGGEYARISGQLGSADKQRLDAHLQAVREIETRLTTSLSETNPACTDPRVPTIDPQANDSFPAVGGVMMDLLVMAFACDLTRVASLQWSRSVSQIRFTWLDIPDGHHDLSHRSDSDTDAVNKLIKINTWYAQQMAGLIARLQSTPDAGGGTLFDSTMVLWTNELAKGNTHSRQDAPYVICGNAGGPLPTGRFLSYEGQGLNHNNLLLSILNALGIPDTSFGEVDWCTGPLAGF